MAGQQFMELRARGVLKPNATGANIRTTVQETPYQSAKKIKPSLIDRRTMSQGSGMDSFAAGPIVKSVQSSLHTIG